MIQLHIMAFIAAYLSMSAVAYLGWSYFIGCKRAKLKMTHFDQLQNTHYAAHDASRVSKASELAERDVQEWDFIRFFGSILWPVSAVAWTIYPVGWVIFKTVSLIGPMSRAMERMGERRGCGRR